MSRKGRDLHRAYTTVQYTAPNMVRKTWTDKQGFHMMLDEPPVGSWAIVAFAAPHDTAKSVRVTVHAPSGRPIDTFRPRFRKLEVPE